MPARLIYVDMNLHRMSPAVWSKPPRTSTCSAAGFAIACGKAMHSPSVAILLQFRPKTRGRSPKMRPSLSHLKHV